MNDYMEVRIDAHCAPELTEIATDLLAAGLAEEGYESFCPDGEGLTAYIPLGLFTDEGLQRALAGVPLSDVTFSHCAKRVEGRDWNSEWEKHYFKPIVVDDRCVIHSSFHADYPKCQFDIVIDPKMAFGTGHHATTSQIIAQLLDLPLEGKRVIDMGTGTGILAILAAKRGASHVTGIEIDPAAEANARENVAANGHPEIDVILGDATQLQGRQADLFIANINRNIIVGDMAAYAAALLPGATMLLSGFYESDIPVVARAAAPFGLTERTHTTKGSDRWACLVLEKSV